MWAYANPIGNAPDEPAHIVRAASVARGQLLGAPLAGHSPAYTVVTVPGTFADLYYQSSCFRFDPRRPAGCGPRLLDRPAPATIPTYVGHYPPLYYAVVGLPALVSTSPSAIYAMRALSAVLSCAFLALAVAAARRWSSSPLLAATAVVVATPLVVFLAGTVNPSGLEISTAVSAWVAAAVLVHDHPESPPAGLLAVLAASAAVLIWSRLPGALWVAVIAASLAPAARGRLAVRALLHRRDVRLCALGLGVAAAGLGVWVLAAGGLAIEASDVPPATDSALQVARAALHNLAGSVSGAAGVVGWATSVPAAAVVMVAVAAAVPVLAVAATGDRRGRVTVAVTAVLAVAVPAAIAVVEARRIGVGEQARYFMPLWVGIPLIAAAVLPPVGVSRGGVPRVGAPRVGVARVGAAGWRSAHAAMVALSTVALGVTFLWALHVAVVGEGGPYWPFDTVAGAWRPPLAPAAFDGLLLVALAAYFAVHSRPPGRDDSPSGRGSPVAGSP